MIINVYIQCVCEESEREREREREKERPKKIHRWKPSNRHSSAVGWQLLQLCVAPCAAVAVHLDLGLSGDVAQLHATSIPPREGPGKAPGKAHGFLRRNYHEIWEGKRTEG